MVPANTRHFDSSLILSSIQYYQYQEKSSPIRRCLLLSVTSWQSMATQKKQTTYVLKQPSVRTLDLANGGLTGLLIASSSA